MSRRPAFCSVLAEDQCLQVCAELSPVDVNSQSCCGALSFRASFVVLQIVAMAAVTLKLIVMLPSDIGPLQVRTRRAELWDSGESRTCAWDIHIGGLIQSVKCWVQALT